MLNHRAAKVRFTEAAVIYSKSVVPQEHKPGEELKSCYLGNEPGLGKELAAQIHPYLGSMLSVIKIILEHRHIIKTVNLISKRLLQKAIVWEVIAFPRRKYILTTEEGKHVGHKFHLNSLSSAHLPRSYLSLCSPCTWR